MTTGDDAGESEGGRQKALPEAIVFFDAECLLCNRSVQWLLREDEGRRLSFAPLSGETASALHEEGVLREEHLEGKSIVLVERTGEEWNALQRSDAVMRALEISGAGRLRLRLLKLLPRVVRDLGYRFVAKTRYVFFGKTSECLLPNEETAGRVLR